MALDTKSLARIAAKHTESGGAPKAIRQSIPNPFGALFARMRVPGAVTRAVARVIPKASSAKADEVGGHVNSATAVMPVQPNPPVTAPSSAHGRVDGASAARFERIMESAVKCDVPRLGLALAKTNVSADEATAFIDEFSKLAKQPPHTVDAHQINRRTNSSRTGVTR
ncbi:hypothetical protein G5S35_04485 [Paraburkholderia tropica]|uniref:hypothetical protein n=1 Tax=Paraburkholderia tropica TaxID=92647 RepID=UPI0016011264|nr:hypothetical protein [Paraburkholderia tropica]QNB10901.1 hypothetical protein G5S35_04485 [Paraburkholderia tropica]